MTVATGTQLGPYEIVDPLGAGGIGEVWRARDSKLDRDIALKILPESMARDKERVLRFEREARLLASLNHPNIASIYGFEEADDKSFLVLELVEGETLAQRLTAGPPPIDDALAVRTQIATEPFDPILDTLEAATIRLPAIPAPAGVPGARQVSHDVSTHEFRRNR